MSSKKKKEEKGVAVTVTPDSPDVKEIIPNRVSEGTWEQWGGWDEVSEIVADVMKLIIDRSWEECEYHYQSSLLIPNSVDWAMREMLQVVEWNFLQMDPGDNCPVEGQVWREEEEPVPCQMDSWTRGKVPIRSKPITTPVSTFFPPPPPATPQQLPSPTQSQEPLLHFYPDSEEEQLTLTTGVAPKPPTQPRGRDAAKIVKKPKHLYRGGGTPQQKHQLEIRTLSECTSLPAPPHDNTLHSLLTQTTEQYLRGHRVPPVPSRRLPANKVTPKISVLQPSTRVTETAKLKHSTTISSRHDAAAFSQLPEPLIEIIDPSPGVSIRQGDLVKRGPRALWNVPPTGPRVVPLDPIRPLEPIQPGVLMENIPRDVLYERNDNLVN